MGFAEATRSELQRIAQASWANELGRISSAANAANPGLVLLLAWLADIPGSLNERLQGTAVFALIRNYSTPNSSRVERPRPYGRLVF